MILIFDTFGGLCNQLYDINSAINFCIINNIKFSFRYCSFRNKNLTSWYNEKFENLFDVSLLEKYKELYINFYKLTLTPENTYNYESTRAIEIFDSTLNILDQLIDIKFEYIILNQFWSIYISKPIITNVYKQVNPCEKLLNNYNEIKKKLLKEGENYNFIHYRYEHDFTNHFKLNNIESLTNLINILKPKFKNPHLKIYIATTNIKNCINLNEPFFENTIIYKNEDELNDFNFEENAFIDYMFGKNATEVYGHKQSSFSTILNFFKQTNNYYNV